MAQFKVIANWMLARDQQYQKLLIQLETNRQHCLKLTSNNTQFCSRDKNDFQQYLRIYTGQTIDKGFRLCKKITEQEPNRDAREIVDECVTLYSMNMEMYHKNVVEKLRSLTHKFNVENL